MAKKKWIPKNLDEGAFTEKAKRAGMTVQEYAAHVLAKGSGADTKTKRQAVMARTFKKMAAKKK